MDSTRRRRLHSDDVGDRNFVRGNVRLQHVGMGKLLVQQHYRSCLMSIRLKDDKAAADNNPWPMGYVNSYDDVCGQGAK